MNDNLKFVLTMTALAIGVFLAGFFICYALLVAGLAA